MECTAESRKWRWEDVNRIYAGAWILLGGRGGFCLAILPPSSTGPGVALGGTFRGGVGVSRLPSTCSDRVSVNASR